MENDQLQNLLEKRNDESDAPPVSTFPVDDTGRSQFKAAWNAMQGETSDRTLPQLYMSEQASKHESTADNLGREAQSAISRGNAGDIEQALTQMCALPNPELQQAHRKLSELLDKKGIGITAEVKTDPDTGEKQLKFEAQFQLGDKKYRVSIDSDGNIKGYERSKPGGPETQISNEEALQALRKKSQK